ncbi:Auxin-responsive protein SAUR50 [Linum grandiflorum]
MGIRKPSNKLSQATVLKQILKRCSSLGKNNNNNQEHWFPPVDVPKGHFAVYVGENRTSATCRRFVVRATFLNHPIFNRVLAMAEEEYGFDNSGPLRIPCDEREFEEVLKLVSRSESTSMIGRSRRLVRLEDARRCSFYGGDKAVIVGGGSGGGEARPLLRG